VRQRCGQAPQPGIRAGRTWHPLLMACPLSPLEGEPWRTPCTVTRRSEHEAELSLPGNDWLCHRLHQDRFPAVFFGGGRSSVCFAMIACTRSRSRSAWWRSRSRASRAASRSWRMRSRACASRGRCSCPIRIIGDGSACHVLTCVVHTAGLCSVPYTLARSTTAPGRLPSGSIWIKRFPALWPLTRAVLSWHHKSGGGINIRGRCHAHEARGGTTSIAC